MDKSDERRVSVRMPFASKGFCTVHETDKKYSGILRDISITGLFMEMDSCPDAGHKCDIEIVMEGAHSRLVIENVVGTILRHDDGGVAIHFDKRFEWFALVPLYFRRIHKQPQPR
ncbi:PilZ domain-containing protein [Desulfocastanea catecholica]